MFTSPDIAPAEDRLVSLLSHWLAGHLRNDELKHGLEVIGTEGLGTEGTEAVEGLLEEVQDARPGQRGGLEMAVRETLEAVALGF